MAYRDFSTNDTVVKRRAIRELIAFVALTFAITFGIGALAIFFRPQVEAIVGPIGAVSRSWRFFVLFDIAASAPTISAIVWSFVFGGLEGVKNLFRGLVRPVQLRWVVVALLTLPIAYLIWGLAERLVFRDSISSMIDINALLVSAPLMLFTTPIIFIDPGGWGEETGWRGFALTRLLTRFSPLIAAIILGAIWAVWHLPAFLISGTAQSHFSFGWFFARDICLSIFMTWIFVNANRNFLVAGFIPHIVNNIAFGAHAVLGIEADAVVMISIAALIIVLSGPGLKGWRFVAMTKPEDI